MHDVRDEAKRFNARHGSHRPFDCEREILHAEPLAEELFSDGSIPREFSLRGFGPEEFVETLDLNPTVLLMAF